MITQAAKMQEDEVGDGSNLVIILAGELMYQAQGLLKMGLHPAEILTGYEKALNKSLELLDSFANYTVTDLTDKSQIMPCMKSVIGSKLYGYEDVLSPLVWEACCFAMPSRQKAFNVDNVRVAKLLGASIFQSKVVRGLVVMRGSETEVTSIGKCKVAVYNCPLEAEQGETKGNV
jgi:T-complex protein 1 subunit theta